MKTFTLTRKARDNHGHEYDVTLTESTNQFSGCKNTAGLPTKNDFVLRIVGTPGSWYMTTLEERPAGSDIISIDFGQRWDCINFEDIFVEASCILANAKVDRLTAAEVKAADDNMMANLINKTR